MSTTPHLGLPLLAAAQAQKHVTHNEALFALDALVQSAVLDKDLSTPPPTPAEGARYIVGPAPTGVWAGKAGLIVHRHDGAWLPITPRIGFVTYVVDEALLYVFTSAGWTAVTEALTAIQNLARLGIGTAADATNPFSAKLNKALWVARGIAEGGTGDLRYTLNKETTANVLSLLFQTGYSGRAELGLIGSDSLVAKVSADGSTWRQAVSIDAASGSVDFLAAEATVASAATVDLGAQVTRRIAITGTTTIGSFGASAYRERHLRFANALTLMHNAASLILPGAANIVTAAGDTAVAVSDGSGNWRVIAYQRADGTSFGRPALRSVSGAALAIGLSPEKIANPSANSATMAGWAFTEGSTGPGFDIATGGYAGGDCFRIGAAGVGSISGWGSRPFSVAPGQVYRVRFAYKANAAAATTVFARMNYKTAAPANLNTAVTSAERSGFTDLVAPGAAPDTWTLVDTTWTCPADTFWASLSFSWQNSTASVVLLLDVISVVEQTTTAEIANKAVTNAKLADAAAASLLGATAAGARSDLTAAQARTVLGLATTDAPTFAGLTATGPIGVPSYTVATLPAASPVGRCAWCSNARAVASGGSLEGAGTGTGSLVTSTGAAWRLAGTSIAASA